MTGSPTAIAHQVKNQLAIMLGFCELVVRSLPPEDPRRADLGKIETAGRAALALLADNPLLVRRNHDDRQL